MRQYTFKIVETREASITFYADDVDVAFGLLNTLAVDGQLGSQTADNLDRTSWEVEVFDQVGEPIAVFNFDDNDIEEEE